MAEASPGILERETFGPVAVLTMNRPPVNALNTEMYRAFLDRIFELEGDNSIRAVVLTAAPGSRLFCAGADIKEFGDFFNPEAADRVCRMTHEINNRIEQLPQITIAAMDADVLGGGAELVLPFDLRVASSAVRFGLPEIKVGQAPTTGGTMRLPWLIGESAARAILLTGDTIGAERAQALGLFHQLVPPGAAREASLAWARDLANRPAQSAMAIKRSILGNRDRDVEAATKRDTDLSAWVFQGDDAKEGQRAFLEKRRPTFTHNIAPWKELSCSQS
jgi:enoyl-CoA hydratase/carnithine racemase